MLWLYLPTTMGAQKVYTKFIRPYVLRHQDVIDRGMKSATQAANKTADGNKPVKSLIVFQFETNFPFYFQPFAKIWPTFKIKWTENENDHYTLEPFLFCFFEKTNSPEEPDKFIYINILDLPFFFLFRCS